jgi:hypothetical protein
MSSQNEGSVPIFASPALLKPSKSDVYCLPCGQYRGLTNCSVQVTHELLSTGDLSEESCYANEYK